MVGIVFRGDGSDDGAREIADGHGQVPVLLRQGAGGQEVGHWVGPVETPAFRRGEESGSSIFLILDITFHYLQGRAAECGDEVRVGS
ncbi:hypothetical protein GCM10023318_06290 [Nocardia callitridis]|uniref:Uncharacterized protein n=1 Tax=Nocardia callitridis TaxID=648753 RepID=A0ABP9JT71_9NOCA